MGSSKRRGTGLTVRTAAEGLTSLNLWVEPNRGSRSPDKDCYRTSYAECWYTKVQPFTA